MLIYTKIDKLTKTLSIKPRLEKEDVQIIDLHALNTDIKKEAVYRNVYSLFSNIYLF